MAYVTAGNRRATKIYILLSDKRSDTSYTHTHTHTKRYFQRIWNVTIVCLLTTLQVGYDEWACRNGGAFGESLWPQVSCSVSKYPVNRER